QQAALETVFSTLQEPLPSYLLEKHQLMNYAQAMLSIHFPQNTPDLNAAIRRLKFEELFYIQLRLLRNKLLNTHMYKGHRFDKVGNEFYTFCIDRLPCPFTNAQKSVIK